MKEPSHSLPKTAYSIAVILILVSLLPGCSFGNLPTVAPTIDPRETFAAIQTESAQTVVADLTRNAPLVEPPQAATATLAMVTATTAPPTDTATVTPVPSFTPITPTATNTRIPATLPPLATNTPVNSGCKITEQSPSFGDDFPKDADFDGRWVVKNTGKDTWAASAVDIKYISGTKFQTSVDIIDLPADVPVDGSYTVIVDMRAPGTAGRYNTSWALVQGGTTLCYLSLTINIIN